MPFSHAGAPAPLKPLRLWPGVVAAVLQCLALFLVPLLIPGGMVFGMIGGVLGGLAIVVWWLFFSRAPWSERLGAIILMPVAVIAAQPIVDVSIANAGMGMMLPIFGTAIMSLGLVFWAVATRGMSAGPRRASMVAAILLSCGVFTLIRTGGITGDAQSDLHWRWTPTPEERLLARANDGPLDSARDKPLDSARDTPLDSAPATATAETRPPTPAIDQPTAPTSAPAAAKTPETHDPDSADTSTAADWPGFRGPGRDGTMRGVRIATDWAQSKPVELWRRPIGPGWSSFAVHGHLLYTQEQRGDEEMVSCYELTTGAPVWRHRDPVRFYESNAGPGPRGTPTFSNGRVYAMGATGILNALDARDGRMVWSRNAAADTGATLPGWGFTSSPLVVDDVVIVAASGRLAAYEIATGHPRWFRQTAGGSYSSPHRVTIDGVAQILLLSGGGATGVAPADGTVLWDHRWPEGSGNIVQPAVTADGDILIGAIDASGSGFATRRIAVAHGSGGWTVKERWTSTALKPAFNDFVVHKGHALGFDGSILASIDLKDGARTWKGGRYGHGQLLLLPDQDVLLVLSEEGELALVSAAADTFTELARFPAIEGKTWNHPVLIGDTLLVRNGEEMAAFRLSLLAAGRD